jgi:hypothetical protein
MAINNNHDEFERDPNPPRWDDNLAEVREEDLPPVVQSIVKLAARPILLFSSKKWLGALQVESRAYRYIRILFLLLMLLAGMALMWFGIIRPGYIYFSDNYAETKGRIERAYYDTKDTGGRNYLYTVKATYSYDVNGKEYRSSSIDKSPAYYKSEFRDMKHAKKAVEELSAMAETVYFNPKSPEEAFMLWAGSDFTFIGVALTLLFALPITLVPLFTFANHFGQVQMFLAFLDKYLPVISKAELARDRLVITTCLQYRGLFWSYSFGMIMVGAGLAALWLGISELANLSGEGQINIAKGIVPILMGLLFLLPGLVYLFWRHKIVINRANRKITTKRSVLFWFTKKSQYDWDSIKTINLGSRLAYMYTMGSNEKIESFVASDRPYALYEKYQYNSVSIRYNKDGIEGIIELKEFGSHWLAQRMARRIARYIDIKLIDSRYPYSQT